MMYISNNKQVLEKSQPSFTLFVVSFLLITAMNVLDYGCPNCGKKYSKKNSLYKHLKFDCGEMRAFQCLHMGCQFRAKRKENLKKHVMFAHKISTENAVYFLGNT
ncbi:hypothetical protein HHI36_020023 [Cryptolaemus montrouzieri]|uniref:C2H2-type domain-containing protein n=1 Tax=Cryptolaemus montrouzieri TaxID=559131 RepID=A0ABD2NA76_9CUCU